MILIIQIIINNEIYELLYYLNEEILLDVKSNKPESIFDYNTNHFINIKNQKKLFSIKILKFLKISDVLKIDDELILISLENNLFEIKLYNYKKNIISAIKANFFEFEFSLN